MLVDECAQAVFVEAGDFAGDQLHARDVGGVLVGSAG